MAGSRRALALALAVAVAACTPAKVRLVDPTALVDRPADRGVIVGLGVSDVRHYRGADEVLERPLAEEMEALVRSELFATGRVTKVVAPNDPAAAMVLQVDVKQLNWLEPRYGNAKDLHPVETAIVAMLGLAGAGAALFMSSRLWSSAAAEFRLTRSQTNEVLLARDLRVDIDDRQGMYLKATTGEAKAEMLRRALTRLMADLRTSLGPVLEKEVP